MKKINDPFLQDPLYIDLHGEDKIGALVKTNELIEDAISLKKKTVVIIHGIGSKILKNTIHEYLKKDKRVLEFKTDLFNDGVTIINLK